VLLQYSREAALDASGPLLDAPAPPAPPAPPGPALHWLPAVVSTIAALAAAMHALGPPARGQTRPCAREAP
jgi:hypothetical protein